MEDSYLLSDLEQVRVFLDPLRQRIVEALGAGPATAKQVAAALGERPSRIYHHVQTLVGAGLIRVVERRRKRGTVERYLAPVAKVFVVDRRLFAGASDAAGVVQHAMVEMLHREGAELERGIAAGAVPLHDADRVELARLPLRLTDRQAVTLMRKLRRLLREAVAASGGRGTERYHLLLGLYPVAPPVRRR